jgi:hypothetical protein
MLYNKARKQILLRGFIRMVNPAWTLRMYVHRTNTDCRFDPIKLRISTLKQGIVIKLTSTFQPGAPESVTVKLQPSSVAVKNLRPLVGHGKFHRN